MENDTDENEHETVIIAGGYEEAFQNSIQSGQLAVVHTQEIIEGSSHSGHEITTLTHTGPKSKYYKQTYRTAWENMPDFKGWLRGVPGEATRAFCIYCQKTLHAHRLSLLKHTCTMRHQKAAQVHQARKLNQQKSFEILVQNTTSENADDQQEEDQEMDEESFLTEETEEQEQENEDEEEEEETIHVTGMKKEQGRKSAQYDLMHKIMSHSSSPISTHVLDTTRGQPIQGLQVSLYKLIEGRWTYINEGNTNVEGRFWHFIERRDFSSGRYKLHYDVDRYFEAKKQDTIYPFVEIVFDVPSVQDRFHIPLLLSPFGYTTYRGS
ncbi:uncharacterized protein [Atheta coriaria]|uniref:uncharacterized protein n=1 Tax=Dalotia coriaria TaxID=877792 RepID=UPI0031F422E9